MSKRKHKALVGRKREVERQLSETGPGEARKALRGTLASIDTELRETKVALISEREKSQATKDASIAKADETLRLAFHVATNILIDNAEKRLFWRRISDVATRERYKLKPFSIGHVEAC